MTEFVIQASGLSKTFGRGASAAKALNEFSLEIPRGGIYGILGHNGAGKSTFFRTCLGLVHPDHGDIRVLGLRPGTPELYSQVGSMIESPQHHPFLTARETLTMLLLLAGRRESGSITYWLERVNLSAHADRKVSGFSTGMKQRLGIAAAFLTSPELVILDEPTNGLDPAGIAEVRALLHELTGEGDTTIVLATHQLDEVRRLCRRVAIISHGRLVIAGELEQLLAVSSRLTLVVSPIPLALMVLGARGERHGEIVLADIADKEIPDLIRSLSSAGVDIFEVRRGEGNVEELFLERTRS